MSTCNFGDRTQPPTDRRRREARARGDVARSASLVGALVLLAGAGALWWLGPPLATELATLLQSGLSVKPAALDQDMVTTQLNHLAMRLTLVVLPVLLVIALAAVVANLMQTGYLWAPTKVIPQFDRLDPGKGIRRWGSMPSWLGSSGSVIKLVLMLGVLAIFVQARLATAGPLMQGSPQAMFALTARLMGELAVVLSLTVLVLAIVDYAWQFWYQEQQLKMTVEEVRRELREDEGDPQLKHRRREIATSSGTAARAVEEVRIV